MAFHVRVSDSVHKEFSKSCKVLGLKQNAIIEGFMSKVINTAHQVEALKNIDGILGIPLDIYNLSGEKVEIIISLEDKNEEKIGSKSA